MSEIADYVKAIEEFSELIIPGRIVNPEADLLSLLKDPNDNPILQTALLGRAENLCTLDRHFYKPDVIQFCQDRGIKFQTDVELLTELITA